MTTKLNADFVLFMFCDLEKSKNCSYIISLKNIIKVAYMDEGIHDACVILCGVVKYEEVF
jgi:hypothetical protein